MKEYKINEISDKRILGRNVKNAGEKSSLNLFWAASALEVNVKSSEVWILVSAKYATYEPWIAVAVNGSLVSRFMAPVEPQWFCISRNLNLDIENLITIMKDDQPMPGDATHSLTIHGIGLSDTGSFEPLKERKYNIEVIGDSITSGEGLAGGVGENDWITQWMSPSKNYAVQLAHKLNANWSLYSQCGWGLCWGWNGDPSSVMPPHYEKVCSIMDGEFQEKLGVKEDYIFPEKTDFVVINLGTNDNGAFFQPPFKDSHGNEYVHSLDASQKANAKDGQYIAKTAASFLKTIRKNNPGAKIIWVWGMMKLAAVPDFIEQGINDYKKETGDNHVYSLVLDAMEDVEITEEDKGSRGHPGPKTHRLAAEKIFSFIQNLQA